MESSQYFRSPEILQPEETVIVVVDVQQKLMPTISNQKEVVWNIRRLLDAGRVFSVPVITTEQYPLGLGPTVSDLAAYCEAPIEKLAFSCLEASGFRDRLAGAGRTKVLVVGIESHVCVQQSVLDLLSAGWRTYVAVDAISARNLVDHEVALRRMETSGATVTTTESVLFEWCQQAGTEEFKTVRLLVTEKPPLA